MLAVSLGYPLGVDNGRYLVQRQNGIHSLSFKAAAVWMQFNGIKVIEDLREEKDFFEALVAQGLIVTADTVTHLLDGINKTIPTRQGAGSLTDNKITIILGNKVVYPPMLQWKIWLQCDGKKPLYEIYSAVRKELSFQPTDFLTALNVLDESDLLFLI